MTIYRFQCGAKAWDDEGWAEGKFDSIEEMQVEMRRRTDAADVAHADCTICNHESGQMHE